tara:strand:- start:4178 stop:4819 length:642 start_codon:yes stop_codon:yes gene_type:complete
MRPAIILGAGGHAKVLAEALIQSGSEVLGFVTPDAVPEEEFFGYRILGDDDVVKTYNSDDILLANGIGMLPRQTLRWRLAAQMRKDGYSFVTVRHPSAIVSSDIILYEGVQVMAGAIIQPGCKIGQDSIINTGSQIEHDTTIGDQCHIAPGVTLSGEVHVGDNVHIGTGAQVIQGIKIGEGSVIAAGTTVYKDVPSGMMVRQQVRIVMEILKD